MRCLQIVSERVRLCITYAHQAVYAAVYNRTFGIISYPEIPDNCHR